MWNAIFRGAVALTLCLTAHPLLAADDGGAVAAFDRVSVSVAGKIRIHQSNEHRVVLAAEESIRERIEVEVNDGLLRIHCRDRCNNLRHQGIDIYVRSLVELNLHNGGQMTLEQGFAAVEQLNVNLHNGGSIHASALAAQRVTAKVYNGGNITLLACAQLDAKIRNGGQIRYHGAPTVDSDVINGGSIDKAKVDDAAANCQASSADASAINLTAEPVVSPKIRAQIANWKNDNGLGSLLT
jgi:hypothetical protein